MLTKFSTKELYETSECVRNKTGTAAFTSFAETTFFIAITPFCLAYLLCSSKNITGCNESVTTNVGFLHLYQNET